ncbi:MAG TPA: citrate/2-methylcitrate synthase [Gammaproteobacteria bacterium]|nr:citrate/2-methylcitrate synthase [Gammaproteobacteria bacterium]
MSTQLEIHKGLEGVVVDVTSISHVDGAAGRLYYRGYPIEDVARYLFAEAAHLIVFGELPQPAELSAMEEYLWQAGRLPDSLSGVIAAVARLDAHPMAALQGLVPLLSLEPPTNRLGRSDEDEEGLVVAARLPAALAALHASRSNRPVGPYPDARRYGERFLAMLNGRMPSASAVEAFERTQILQIDHGFNASTFTARVVTSTLAPPASALAAAMGALYGPLHGAADQRALEMAQEVGDPDRAAQFVAECLASGRRVMGMGHREYRVVDPRAKIIKELAKRMIEDPEHLRLLRTLAAVEEAFVEQTSAKRRPLRANVEFYKGVVYAELGIPKDLFTACFASARVFGWLAHCVEQRRDNRLIRPSAQYVGPPPRKGGA